VSRWDIASVAALLSVAFSCTRGPESAASESPSVDAGSDGGGQSSNGGASGSTGAVNGGATSEPPLGCDKIDILFVIDNSITMQDEQENLATNYPKLIDVLNQFNEGKLDYRVGVTTTSFPTELFGITFGNGEKGALLESDAMKRPWLERTDKNVQETFARLATVGVEGSPREQQLNAAKAAVTERVADGSNKGFMRDDALLAIVILTDGDDDSLAEDMSGDFSGGEAKVSDFIASFDEVKGSRSRWATAVIAGDRAPLCTSQFGDATYATRLIEFVEDTGSNGVFSSICDGDLSKSLKDALETFMVACDNFIVI